MCPKTVATLPRTPPQYRYVDPVSHVGDQTSVHNLQTEAYTEDLKRAGVEEVLTQVLDKNLQYPDYYLDKFHVCLPSTY